MRLLIISDAGCHTGFGVVTHAIGERLVRDHGWEVHVLAANYRGDDWPTNLHLYPATLHEPKDVTGMSRVVEMLGRVVPDAVLMLNDPHMVLATLLNNSYDPNYVLWRGIELNGEAYRPPIVAYLPIDGYESPRSWDKLAERVTRVAMSHHGQATMPEAPVIWHGVDTSVFYPRDKREAKRAIGYDPDRFLVLRVDKNSIRKDYPATWKALRPLLRKYDDIDVHFHCLPHAIDGYAMLGVMWNDEDIRDRVKYSPNLGGFSGWPDSDLALLMAAADVFVSTSWGEGFGLTILEAMACGTPVIAGDHSAVTEVVGPGGVLVPPAGRITVPMGQEQCLPDIAGYTAAIERLYLGRGSRRKLGAAAVEQARRFSWDEAARRMNVQLTKAVTPPLATAPTG